MRFDAISLHQLAYKMRKIPILPRVIDGLIFLLFNSAIHYSTKIGKGTIAAYRGMSILIHKDAVIGKNVVIGVHVVIGGRSGKKQLPIIEDNVEIGSNACILGDVRIGANSIIGAGAVVLSDVTPNSVVAGVPAKSITNS